MQTSNPKQLGALGFCAFSVPAILLLPQNGWVIALFAALAASILMRMTPIQLPKTLRLALAAWNVLMLGYFARILCFPEEKELIGLLLLLLAVYAAAKQTVPRVASVLLFFLGATYLALMGFALPDVQWSALTPRRNVDWRAVPFALAPALLLYIRKERGATDAWFSLAAIVLAALAAIVTQGMHADSFYTAAKSVNILGTMERLEPLVSAALTAGGFCLLGLLCTANQSLLENRSFGVENFLGGCLGFYLAPVLPSVVLVVGTAIFWGLLPILPQWVVKLKKFKKIEKSA